MVLAVEAVPRFKWGKLELRNTSSRSKDVTFFDLRSTEVLDSLFSGNCLIPQKFKEIFDFWVLIFAKVWYNLSNIKNRKIIYSMMLHWGWGKSVTLEQHQCY